MTAPYKEAAFRYLTHGWRGPLPVGNQPQQKTHPPAGYTGNDGTWPNDDQIAEWVNTRPNVNIALRLPPDIIGIDVDDYADKPGADTMIATTENHGKLPRTWISTSREGRSGIRWFRLENPETLPGKLVHPDDQDISGVEIIQHTHRYAIVPPSVHPEGGEYRWIDPDGAIANGQIPKPPDLPAIPQAWVDHIRQDCSCWAPFRWERYETQPKDPVEAAYRKWAARMTEAYGRHDAALGGVMALTAFKEKGWPGADHYLEQLQADFHRALADSRTPQEATAEWERMIDGAEKKAATSSIPVWQPQAGQGPPPPETFDARVEEELDRLRVRDSAQRRFKLETQPPAEPPPILTLRERLARPQPDTEWRIEGWQPIGTRVLLAAQYKAGKTTLTGNLARCLVDNCPWLDTAPLEPVVTGHVTIIDFEMSERQIDQWLSDQGITADDKVIVIPMRGKAQAFDILDDTVRKEWASRLRGTEYLILDCLRPILDALGLDEHREAGRFLTAFDALCDEADIDDALVVHHMGHTGERSRGDSRLRDWPDVEWRLVRETDEPDSPRYISAYGRDVEQSEAQIRHDDATRHITLVGGTRSTAAARAALPDIIELLGSSEPLPKARIEKEIMELDHSLHAVRDAIKLGIYNGQLRQELGARGAHLITLPVSSSDLVTARHDEVPPTSSARLRADEVVDDSSSPPKSRSSSSEAICSTCKSPVPGTHLSGCGRFAPSTEDIAP